MKISLSAFVVIPAFVLLVSNSSGAQTPIVLEIQSMLSGQPFELNKTVPEAVGPNFLSITRLQYYLSSIVIIHDGGVQTTLTETHVLVNPAQQSKYSLGSIDATQVEGIRFTVGVDAIHNHLDPSTYPPGHPLGLQNPSMHWGWSAGYRFVVIEGLAGSTIDNANTMWQIHTVGDELVREVTIMVNGQLSMVNGQWSVVVPVRADYENVVAGIDVAQGIINHSNENEAIDVMNNMGTSVFSAGTITSVGEIVNERTRVPKYQSTKVPECQMNVYPNPVRRSDILTLQFNNPTHRTIVARDMLGRTVRVLETDDVSIALPTNEFVSGMYALTVADNNFTSTQSVIVD